MECQQSRGCLEKATSNVCQRQADKLLQFTYSDPDIQFGYTLVQSAWLFVDCKGNVSRGENSRLAGLARRVNMRAVGGVIQVKRINKRVKVIIRICLKPLFTGAK